MISPAGFASPLLSVFVGSVGMAGEQKEFHLNIVSMKICNISGMFLLQLTVTLRKIDKAAGAGVTVLPGVVRFAEATSGQILAGTVREL